MTTSRRTGFSLLDRPRDEAAHEGMQWDLWWFTTILQAGDRRLSVQAITTQLSSGVSVIMTITDLDSDLECSLRTFETLEQVSLSRTALDVETERCSFAGSFETGYRLRGTLEEGAGFDLVLKPTRSVLFNGGAGSFNLQGIPTFQYSIGALEASGTVRWEGGDLVVSGHGWHDRQWEALPREGQPEFTWFGIDLANGDTLSVWHAAGEDGWATILRPDGTHVVTAADAAPDVTRLTGRGRIVPQGWTLTIPTMQAELTVTQARILDHERLYTGALDVVGIYEGERSNGQGFCDISGPIDKPDERA